LGAVLLRHIGSSALREDDVRDLIDYICEVAVQQSVFFLWRPAPVRCGAREGAGCRAWKGRHAAAGAAQVESQGEAV